MILYIWCACKSTDRILVANYKKQGYEIKTLKHNISNRIEASDYGLEPPFVVENGVARCI